MSDTPPPNVKVYDRPERKGIPPLLLALVLAVLLVIGVFSFKAYSAAQSPVSVPQQKRESRAITAPLRIAHSITGDQDVTRKTQNEDHRWFL
jgi:hypothetical protein